MFDTAEHAPYGRFAGEVPQDLPQASEPSITVKERIEISVLTPSEPGRLNFARTDCKGLAPALVYSDSDRRGATECVCRLCNKEIKVSDFQVLMSLRLW